MFRKILVSALLAWSAPLYAIDVKIDDLPAATTPLAGTERLPIVQGTQTVKTTAAQLTAGRAVSAGSLTLTTPLAVTSGGTGATAATGSGALVLGTMPTITAPTLISPILGTITSGVLTNATGLPLSTGVTGTLPIANGGTGATAATGTGNVVLASGPTLSGATLGTPVSVTLTNATGLPLTTGVTGILPVANGGTGVNTSTGTGSNVLATSPTLVTPALGVPSSITLTNATGLPLGTGVTGALPAANGGTGATSFTANGVAYASSTSALTTGSALQFNGTGLGVGAAPTSALTVAGSGQFTSSTAPTAGAGVEVSSNGVTSYDRTGAAYRALQLNALQHQFLISGAEKARITSTGGLALNTTTDPGAGNLYVNGLVGIGANVTAGVPLSVSGATGNVSITSTTGTNRVMFILSNTGGNSYFGVENSAGNGIFGTGGLPYATAINASSAQALQLGTNNIVRATIDTSGNLDIGQTSGSLQSGGTGVTLYGATSSEIKFLNSSSGSTSTDGTALLVNGLDFQINNREAGNIIFGTSNASAMWVTSTGALGVGATAVAGSKSSVSADGNAIYLLDLNDTNATNPRNWGLGPTGNNLFSLVDRTAGSVRWSVDNNGKMTVAGPLALTPSITTSSTTGALSYGYLSYSDTNKFATFQTSVNSYAQMVLQNTSNGATASTVYCAVNDVGTASAHQGCFGINGSGHTGTGSLNLASAVFFSSLTGDLVIGTGSSNAIHMVANGATIDAAGVTTGNVFKTGVYTVSTLPTCNSGAEGGRAGVTDLTSPTFMGTPTGGGTVHGPVYCNGTAWIVAVNDNQPASPTGELILAA